MSKTIAIAAGGTGGHVMPALALSQVLEKDGFRVVWVAVQDDIATRWVKVPLLALPSVAWKGKGWKARLKALYRLSVSMWKVWSFFRRESVSLVLGFGGFSSMAPGLVAFLCRYPLHIHEQNARAGLANRLLARVAQRVWVAYPGVLNGEWVGNPLREGLSALSAGVGVADSIEKILVLGGSLGARQLNEMVPQFVERLSPSVQVWHQCGREQEALVRNAYGNREGVRVESWVNVEEALPWADLVIARAGAMTLSELACLGCVAIIVPYPYAADDHQRANARYFEERGGMVVLDPSTFSPDALYLAWQALTPLKRAAMREALRGSIPMNARAMREAIRGELNE